MRSTTVDSTTVASIATAHRWSHGLDPRQGLTGGRIETRSLLLTGTLIVVTIVVCGVGPSLALATTGPIEHATARDHPRWRQ